MLNKDINHFINGNGYYTTQLPNEMLYSEMQNSHIHPEDFKNVIILAHSLFVSPSSNLVPSRKSHSEHSENNTVSMEKNIKRVLASVTFVHL